MAQEQTAQLRSGILACVRVVGAAILQADTCLVAQRGAAMSMPLKWEFPGGKIKPGETPEDCVQRELLEELGVEVVISESLPTLEHDYGSFSVILHPFLCGKITGEVRPHEHAAVIWLVPEALMTLDWAEADYPLIEWLSARGKSVNGPA